MYCQLLPGLLQQQQLVASILLLAACVRCMLVAYLHIFVSCWGVHLHWQASDICGHGRLTRSAFDVTCMMPFLCETWGLSLTRQICAVMITRILCSSHALCAVFPVMIQAYFVALMLCVLYIQ